MTSEEFSLFLSHKMGWPRPRTWSASLRHTASIKVKSWASLLLKRLFFFIFRGQSYFPYFTYDFNWNIVDSQYYISFRLRYSDQYFILPLKLLQINGYISLSWTMYLCCCLSLFKEDLLWQVTSVKTKVINYYIWVGSTDHATLYRKVFSFSSF